METLSSHSHPNLPWHRSSAESGFVFAILVNVSQRTSDDASRKTYLANENRAAKERLFGKLANGALGILL